ncbi:MAG: hypothetical protein ACLUVY_05605 [Bacteroides uniformis]
MHTRSCAARLTLILTMVLSAVVYGDMPHMDVPCRNRPQPMPTGQTWQD